MRIEKKCWPESFSKIMNGEKKFDLRIADFECRAGDVLALREYDPEKKEYTGRVVEKEISYVMKINEQPFYKKDEVEKHGLMILSLK